MKTFIKMFRTAFVFCMVMMLLCSMIYPLTLTGVSQMVMKEKANGSLINEDGELTANVEEAVGSELLGQAFTEDYFFHGRVSSINYNTYTKEQLEQGEYTGVASGTFNYGNSNPDLEARIQEDLDEFLASHPDVKPSEIPSDLLTASGSGLDPHISLEAARVQIPAVAEHSGLGEDVVTRIVEDHTEYKTAGVFGEDRVNVLKCNLEIAKAMGILDR